VRPAVAADFDALHALIEASVRGLQTTEYSEAQREAALKHVYGVDTALVEDGTYFLVEDCETTAIVGCGGWSMRRTLFGGDQYRGREDNMLDPEREPAKIRAFFVHPAFARRGIGSLILSKCEAAARAAGFKRLEMGATLTGVPFYKARGYEPLEPIEVPMPGGESLCVVRMGKATP